MCALRLEDLTLDVNVAKRLRVLRNEGRCLAKKDAQTPERLGRLDGPTPGIQLCRGENRPSRLSRLAHSGEQ